jgi:serine/threonine-protein kinase
LSAVAEPQRETVPEGEAASSASSYAILAKLATGGMAELFLARTVSSAGVERYVVLKRVLPDRLKDTNFVAMFLDEARLAAQLQHPNIAQVLDTGKFGASYFLSMEYVHGETVREIIHRTKMIGQPIPIGCALTIIANAASGLHHAHERLGLDGKPLNIVHRDVSPSNLMVTYEGNVKVVDFGVAKATRRSAETQTGTVKGKIGYLSPEQCRGRTSDRRSDLFSLGIVLWELLVGERMYKRENDYDTMEAIVLDPPVPPSTRRPEVPLELDAVIMKMLAKAPGDRYQNADEVHDALERVADATGIRISTAALKRFVVELFGKRPEPWIEMQTRDAAQEVVTVSAAVIGGLDTVLTSLVDSQLSSLPDLTNTPSAPRRSPTPLAFTAERDPEEVPRRPTISPSHARKDSAVGSTLKVHATSNRIMWIAAAALALVAGVVIAWRLFGRDDAAARGGDVLASTVVTEPVAKPPEPPAKLPESAVKDPVPVKVPDAAKAPEVVAKPEKPEKRAAKPPEHHRDEIAANMRAQKYADVVVACLVTPRALAQNIAACTIAACQMHDANARAWFTSVPAKSRDSVIAQCGVAGVNLSPPKVEEVKPKKPDCTDPMECWK